MDAESSPAGGKTLLDIMVGVETGILGGLLMLLWLILVSPMIGEPWWSLPNLFASTLYVAPRRYEASVVTLVGSAVHLLICGLIGAVNGLLTPGGRLFGLGVAGAWYLLCYLLVWKRAAPMLLAHGWQPLLAGGYFLFGSALGQQSYLMSRLRS